MKVDIELIDAGEIFTKKSGMHPEKPLVNVTWEIDNKKFAAISTIESILCPDLCPQYVTLPETVREEVEQKYGFDLIQYFELIKP